MSASEHDLARIAPAAPVSAHFVNNVLAATASYVEDDPDRARDVLAELGRFLGYRLRELPASVAAADELAHATAYLRLQQARFPDRLDLELPDAQALEAHGPIAPLSIQGPVAEALERRLGERPGRCAVALLPSAGGLEVELRCEGELERLDLDLGGDDR